MGTRPDRHSAYYWAPIEAFLSEDAEGILGTLVSRHFHALDLPQREAWLDEIGLLKAALPRIQGTIYLEFDVPRLGSRIDAVVIAGAAVFPIEFKCGEASYGREDYAQAWDYALDLKNFHSASHGAPILPILVATEAKGGDTDWEAPHQDGVYPPFRCNARDLGPVLEKALKTVKGVVLDGHAWGLAPYQPTPTIIDAARVLYSQHSVDSITRNDAGATNLRVTSTAVEEIIDRSRSAKEKAILFVTGVPGAGKTLVGLNIATRREGRREDRAVYLSGNGPLVKVLQEALIRDSLQGLPKEGRKDARQAVKAFIQNVHHFRDEGIRTEAPPFDHVVIFDEAQRAWDRQKTADFMKRRKRLAGFEKSEPEFLVSYLDRHQEWAVVVCLVGGGQEIYRGEAGIAEWLEAVTKSFSGWQVYISPSLSANEYRAADALIDLSSETRLRTDPRLHLASSMRSFRSEKVSALVAAMLERDVVTSRALLSEVLRAYPIAVTRDLTRAKQWIRDRARGSERYGVVASSQGRRLKPHAIDVRVPINPVHWFLNKSNDTRSSFYMEDVATEFQIQGLELDWVCVGWDADLRVGAGAWNYHAFRGKRWTSIKKERSKRYLLNAYRVLLTRARQGMVIFVPHGEPLDRTRDPRFYDGTYDYLVNDLGIAQA